MKQVIIFILYFIFLQNVYAESKVETKKVAKVKWAPLTGALKYLFQVSNSELFNRILYEEKLKDTNIEFDVEKNYKFFRVAGIDKSNLKGEFSDIVSLDKYTKEINYSSAGRDFYIKISDVNWKSGAIDTMSHIQNSTGFGNLLYQRTGLTGTSNLTNTFQSNSIRGKAVELGYRYGSQSGKWKGRFSIRGITSNPFELSNVAYQLSSNSSTDMILNQIANSYSSNPLKMGLIQYNQEYYFNPSSSNKYLKGLGLQGGLNAQFENFYSSTIPIGFTASYIQGITGTQSYLAPVPLKSSYKNQTDYINLGFIYRFEIGTKHELEIGANYLKGISNGVNHAQYLSYFPSSISSLPYINQNKTNFDSNVSGTSVNASFSIKFLEKHGFKVSFENRRLNYHIQNSKTSTSLGQPVYDYMNNNVIKDSMSYFGLEYFYRF